MQYKINAFEDEEEAKKDPKTFFFKPWNKKNKMKFQNFCYDFWSKLCFLIVVNSCVTKNWYTEQSSKIRCVITLDRWLAFFISGSPYEIDILEKNGDEKMAPSFTYPSYIYSVKTGIFFLNWCLTWYWKKLFFSENILQKNNHKNITWRKASMDYVEHVNFILIW